MARKRTKIYNPRKVPVVRNLSILVSKGTTSKGRTVNRGGGFGFKSRYRGRKR